MGLFFLKSSCSFIYTIICSFNLCSTLYLIRVINSKLSGLLGFYLKSNQEFK